ncbi:TPA: cell division protein FtsZ, partial [Patescibacteria group bacterium]|nr:cell division protein FtsZ [Patescibacteria group bacterium]
DEAMQGEVKITVIATGFDENYGQRRKGGKAPMAREETNGDMDEKDTLDVPAFIRKKIR